MTQPSADLPVRPDWFEVTSLGNGVTCYTEPAVHSFLRANCWHVRGSDRDLLVDAGLGVADLAGLVRARHRR
ncbi:MAG: hypothetical protein OEW53_07495, partial [Actinomycetota bacterium]|nr:hypothetical protein [Actinomycetota bacterium]